MAAGPITVRTIDSTPLALRGWQCLKAPVTAAETALTATKLLDDMRLISAAESTVEVIPVLDFDMIQCMMIANGTADQSPVLNLYGWGETGPGHHIGTLTTDISTAAMTVASTSFLASSRTHISIRNAFTSATAWKIADQYVVTADYEQERQQDDLTAQNIQTQSFRALNVPGTSAFGGTIGTATTEANWPQVFNVDFSHSDYSFFGVLPTALDSATSVGLIFRAVRMKARL
jgi:hypothetical protein